jgi:hypothetical protein
MIMANSNIDFRQATRHFRQSSVHEADARCVMIIHLEYFQASHIGLAPLV